MSLFPRIVASEFAPMFRLMDDYVSHVATRNNGFGSAISQTFRTFQPRFDVKETKETYELHGELPGIDQKDINIEFTDAQTLSIKGRTESRREEGSRPSAVVEDKVEQAKLPDAESSSYHKATVEEDDTAGPGSTTDALTPTTTNASQTVQQSEQVSQPEAQQPAKDKSRYWVSERSIGEFARSFSFPSRVDQEHVKASLKNGILSVVIPKAQAPALKRINIE